MDVLRRGATSGVFQLTDVPGTALAITSMCVDVARWFPTGSLHSPADVSALYSGLALRLAGYR